MRTFEYRLYPNRAQRQQLLTCLVESRVVYNEMLEALKAQYDMDGTFLTKYDLTARFKGRGGDPGPPATGQTLAAGPKKGRETHSHIEKMWVAGGFPRLQKPKRWHSSQLREYGIRRHVRVV